MRDARKYLYQNPHSGAYTGFWACARPRGKYVGLWPFGLIKRIFQLLGKPETILEPFAGKSKLGVGIDLNRNVKPSIIADAQHLPIKDDSFHMVLLDPPYDVAAFKHYSAEWPRRYHKLKFRFYKAWREAAKVVKPEGHLIVLHFLMPVNPDKQHFKRVATIGISPGPNKNIRCLSIFRKYKTKQQKLE